MFPDLPYHAGQIIPTYVMLTFIPFTVVAGVRYSPKRWGWKIPYYWVIVHLALISELLMLYYTRIISFLHGWDLWDSYTLWWIFYLLFEWIGGKMVPASKRKPLHTAQLRFGRWGWIIVHFILISTIFVFGMYTGKELWGH
jgi:hypothetical protein